MEGFTDIHAHFLYGMDDGAADADEMRAMLESAVSEGVAHLYATPHVEPGIRPFDHDKYAERFDEAVSFCRGAGLPLTLHRGGEVLYSAYAERHAVDRTLPTLGDTDRVLVEFFEDVSAREIETAADTLLNAGYTPVFAHVERYRAMYDKEAFLLKERFNVLYQVNCRPVIGGGIRVRSYIKKWLDAGLIDFIASDMHDTRDRICCIKEAYAEIKRKYGAGYADSLTKGAGLIN